jgi:predicted dehydrogenase
MHFPLASAALAKCKHVVCEKPLGVSPIQTAELSALVVENGAVAAVPFVYRFYSTVRDARARIAQGEIGSIHLIHGSYLQDWLAHASDHNWRVDPTVGGRSRAFGDIGVHWCDLIEFVTGHRITRLFAELATVHKRRGPSLTSTPVSTEDCAAVIFTTDHGATGNVVLSQVSAGRKNELYFSADGDAGSIAFDQENPNRLWWGGIERNTVTERASIASLTDNASRYNLLPAGHPQGFQDCFNAFVADVYAAVSGCAPDGLPTFADGHRAAVLTEAVLASASTGEWVDVDA